MTAESPATRIPPRRRWRRWLLVALALAAAMPIARGLFARYQRQAAIARIEAAGGEVSYDFHYYGNPPPAWPVSWIQACFGREAFARPIGAHFFETARVQDDDLACLIHLPSITVIDLYGTGITDTGMDHVALLPDLRGLQLADTRVTAAGLKRLAAAHPKLDNLLLAGPAVTDGLLESLADFGNLAWLRIENALVGDRGIRHVASLSQLRYLEIIDCPAVGDAGLVHLMSVSSMIRLSLRGKGITDAGMARLATLQSLQQLDLRCTAVTDAGMQHLAALNSLTMLIVGPRVTPTAVHRLRQSLPRCHVALVGADGEYEFVP